MHVEGPGLCLPDNGAFVLLLTQGFLPAAGHSGSPVTYRWGDRNGWGQAVQAAGAAGASIVPTPARGWRRLPHAEQDRVSAWAFPMGRWAKCRQEPFSTAWGGQQTQHLPCGNAAEKGEMLKGVGEAMELPRAEPLLQQDQPESLVASLTASQCSHLPAWLSCETSSDSSGLERGGGELESHTSSRRARGKGSHPSGPRTCRDSSAPLMPCHSSHPGPCQPRLTGSPTPRGVLSSTFPQTPPGRDSAASPLPAAGPPLSLCRRHHGLPALPRPHRAL